MKIKLLLPVFLFLAWAGLTQAYIPPLTTTLNEFTGGNDYIVKIQSVPLSALLGGATTQAILSSITTNYIQNQYATVQNATSSVHSGYFDQALGVGTTSPTSIVHVVDRSTSAASVTLQQASSVTEVYPQLIIQRSSGNPSAPSNVLNQTPVGGLVLKGYNDAYGPEYITAASIVAIASNPSGTDLPSFLQFNTAQGVRVVQERMRLDSNGVTVTGNHRMSGNLVMGYDPGISKNQIQVNAGGSVPSQYPRLYASDESFVEKAILINPATGYVGIGTTAPSSKVDVFNGSITVRGTNAGVNISGGGLNVTGNVGIGTRTVTEMLHVHNPNSSQSFAHFSNVSNGTGLDFGLSGADAYLLNRENGLFYFGTNDNVRLRIADTGSVWIPGNTGIGTPDTNVLGLLHVGASSFIVTQNGNVGIGTMDPGNKLTIDESSNDTSFANSGAQTILRLRNTNSTTNNFSYITWHDSANLFAALIGTRFTNHTSHYGDLVFGTRGSGGIGERMTIHSGGNVGIGTTAPVQSLEVSGNATRPGIFISDQATGLRGGMQNNGAQSFLVRNNVYRNSAGTDITPVLTNSSWDFWSDVGSADWFAIRRSSNGTSTPSFTTLFTVLGSGNVGIGTTAPIFKLDVHGTAQFESATIGYGVTPAVIRTDDGTKPITFQINTSEKMRIDTAGNVGIGTTSPIYKLDIRNSNGYTYSNNAATYGDFHVGGSGGGDVFLYADTSNNAIMGAATNSNLAIRTNNTDRMTIASGGNVGIGTTSPGYLFEVNNGTMSVKNGPVYINFPGSQLIMKSPDGTCSACGPSNLDVWTCAGVTCP